MTATLWYTDNVELQPTSRPKRGRPRKKDIQMSTTQTTAGQTQAQPAADERKFSAITKTVFDLTQFDDVKLTKDFTPPTKPSTLQEALALVSHDEAKLINLVYEGLISEARNAQYDEMSGFKVINEDGTIGAEYTGSYADGDKAKLINNAVLTVAKLQAGGTWDTLPKEKKASFKENAQNFLRSNPAMLASLQGTVAEPAAGEQK